jgi:hypothetical protein
MVAAVDMRNFGTLSHMGDEEALMDTFDQALTPASTPEPFWRWCKWEGVDTYEVRGEGNLMLGLLALSPFFGDDAYGTEGRYDLLCYINGGEDSYLDTLQVLLS